MFFCPLIESATVEIKAELDFKRIQKKIPLIRGHIFTTTLVGIRVNFYFLQDKCCINISLGNLLPELIKVSLVYVPNFRPLVLSLLGKIR